MQRSRNEGPAPIGVLLFANAGDRVVGDPGMPGTFPFPVRYGIVSGSYRDLVEGSLAACQRLCDAARELEAQGVSAIAGDCGLMSLYQGPLAGSVKIPVISSSLVLLPLAGCLIGESQKIGILTGHSKLLGKQHLRGAKADLSRLVIQGMEDRPHFRQVVLEGTCPQDYDRMAKDVLNAAELLLERDGDIGAILLECSNLAPFSAEIENKYKIPVLDCNMAVRLLYRMTNPTRYPCSAT